MQMQIRNESEAILRPNYRFAILLSSEATPWVANQPESFAPIFRLGVGLLQRRFKTLRGFITNSIREAFAFSKPEGF